MWRIARHGLLQGSTKDLDCSCEDRCSALPVPEPMPRCSSDLQPHPCAEVRGSTTTCPAQASSSAAERSARWGSGSSLAADDKLRHSMCATSGGLTAEPDGDARTRRQRRLSIAEAEKQLAELSTVEERSRDRCASGCSEVWGLVGRTAALAHVVPCSRLWSYAHSGKEHPGRWTARQPNRTPAQH